MPGDPKRDASGGARDLSAASGPLIAVFGASRTAEGSTDWEDAFALGAALARRGYGVVTGGYAGTMAAVSAGAASADRGVPIVGVTVPGVFLDRPGGNRWLTREIRAASLLSRMESVLEGAVAAVALPGSIGTFTEIMVAWNLAYVARFAGTRPVPLITVGAAWRDLCAHVADRTGTDAALVRCVAAAEDVPPALDALL